MKRYYVFIMIALAVSCLLYGAMGKKRIDAPQEDVEALVSGNSEFAFDLYAKLKGEPKADEPAGNLFFSPYSISTALAMTWAGARGETETNMAETLHFTLEPERVHKVFGSLENQLNTGGKKGGYKLSVANALWGQKGEPFLDDFTEIINKYYGAGLVGLDFAKDAKGASKKINSWIEKKTQDKIKNLISEDAIGRDTTLVLTNAIYFKGKWQMQFDKKNTKDAPFTVSAEEKVQVPMMYLKDDFKYWADEKLQVIKLPYKGEHLSMLILLPREVDGLAELEKSLTAENLKGWLAKLREEEIAIYLPRFKVTWGVFELAAVLKEMGLPLKGDFTGISGDPRLFISNILHKAFVEVNEEGTEAAAATAVVMTKTAIRLELFRADHPFVFMIRDNRSQSVLFMGRVVNPAK